MGAARETQFDSAMNEALADKATAYADVLHQLDGVVLQDAGANAVFNVVAGVGFEYDRFNAFEVQEMGEEQSGRSGSDDADLSAHRLPSRYSGRWPEGKTPSPKSFGRR